MTKIQKPEFVNIREAFRHEAHQFTVWLEQNIDVLSYRLGIDLNVIQREKSVGSFNVDLLCEDAEGVQVIIENQLERTDHDHLGKLMTYLVNLDAQIAIWVTTEARPEHQRVIDWFNEITPLTMAFYLVQVEATRIADGVFMPIFYVLAGPDEQTRQIGHEKKDLAGRRYKQLEFWEQLLEKNQRETALFTNISPSARSYLATGIGKSGIELVYRVKMNSGRVDLYIDVGDKEINKEIYDSLYAEKENIEADFGEKLDWYRRDDKKASRIGTEYDVGGLVDDSTWNQLQDKMIDAMIRLDNALRQRINRMSW